MEYIKPEIQMIVLETEDVITTSVTGPGGSQQGNDVEDP